MARGLGRIVRIRIVEETTQRPEGSDLYGEKAYEIPSGLHADENDPPSDHRLGRSGFRCPGDRRFVSRRPAGLGGRVRPPRTPDGPHDPPHGDPRARGPNEIL